MSIIQTFSVDYKSEIIDLYIEAFSTGLSTQYIDIEILNQYLDDIFQNGYVLLSIDNKRIIGAILCCPLKMDGDLPTEIYHNYSVDKCVYVAEMMVTTSARGMGIGTKLLKEFFQTVDKSMYTDAFIRVWDQNKGAITLYKKNGFEPITSIEQTKKKADGNGTFVMKKIYLHKKLV